jgi:hypothetical protein
MGDHDGSEMVLPHDPVGQMNDLFRRLWIEGSGVFIQKQEFGQRKGGHEQGKTLTLAPGEEANTV